MSGVNWIVASRPLTRSSRFIPARTKARRLLTTIPGVGPLNATAFVAAIDNAQAFGRGRDLAAWLGLVPRQMTTGGKPRLLGISKRGNGYLRKMLIYGARAALPTLSKGQTCLEAGYGACWQEPISTRCRRVAAKLARIIWSVLRNETALSWWWWDELDVVMNGQGRANTSKVFECLWVVV